MIALNEASLRTPDFTAGPAFTGADGQRWHLPDLDLIRCMTPRLKAARVWVWCEARDKLDDNWLTMRFAAAALVRTNYDLDDDQLESVIGPECVGFLTDDPDRVTVDTLLNLAWDMLAGCDRTTRLVMATTANAN